MNHSHLDPVPKHATPRRTTARPIMPVLWCGLAAIVTLAALLVALRALDSARLAQRDRARALAVVADAERLNALRASLAAEGADGTGAEPAGSLTPTLAARVSGVLTASGLPQSSLAGLSPESVVQRSDAGTALRVRATLTLQSITLPEVGRFIAEWRTRHPAWALTSIDLVPEAGIQSGNKSAVTPGSDLPVRTVLVVESIAFDPHEPHDPHQPSNPPKSSADTTPGSSP